MLEHVGAGRRIKRKQRVVERRIGHHIRQVDQRLLTQAVENADFGDQILFKSQGLKKKDEEEVEIEIEIEQPKRVKQRLRGDADYRMDGIHAEDSQIKMLNFGAKLIQEVYKIRDDSQGGLNLLTRILLRFAQPLVLAVDRACHSAWCQRWRRLIALSAPHGS